MRLAIVYHRPYYRDAEGGFWEAEGSFSRYVESASDQDFCWQPQRDSNPCRHLERVVS